MEKIFAFFLAACLILAIEINAQTPSLVWAQRAGSTSYDVGWSVITDAAGNVYTAGHFRGTADFDPGPGTFNLTAFGVFEDIFISKSDANGNFLWAKSFGSTTQDLPDQAQGITYRAGNIYVTGLFSGTVDFDPGVSTTNLISVGGKDIFVLKLDINGNFVWAKSMGSVKDDTAYSIATDASQNIYTTGGYEALADFDPGPSTFNLPNPISGSAIFISKLDMAGNFGWAISLGAGNAYNIAGFSIATDLAGNVYTTGIFRATIDFDSGAGIFNLTSATNSANDIFILKLTSSGSFAWAKSMGSSNEDNGQSIVIDVSGNVVTTGYFDGTVDFDPGAGVSNLTSFGTDDIFISKLDANGNFVWAKQLGGTEEDDGLSVATDAAGNIYTTGFFQDVADFDPGTGIFNLTAVGTTYDIFISKLDANGNFVWATSIGSTGNDYGRAITTDGSGNTITTGNFKSTADFNPGAATLNFTSAGNDDIFTQKLSSPIVALPTITSFTPSSGPIGTTVTIIGTNFSSTPANNTVKFNGTMAVATASTATSITTTVPTGATTGKISVAVAGNSATSTNDFTVTTSGVAVTINVEPLGTRIGGTVTKNLVPLITTIGNNLDINSITVIVQPPSGAVASISKGTLTVDYTNISFSGKESITIRACDTNGNCATKQFDIEVAGDVVVYNAVSPNGDKLNEYFYLKFIDTLSPKNQVSIYNRWGDEVFSISDYDNKTRVFAGLNNDGNKLPVGTYFYKIVLATANKTLTGFLSLKY
jgi:gliding motility-associated-like protein